MRLEELFPYPAFRLGQQELAESVYQACKRKDRLVIEAISGFGKTSSVLAGSILAAVEDDTRIIYACRTKRQVLRVVQEIQQIQRRTKIDAAALFAKIDYCLLKEMSKFPVDNQSFKWYCSFNTTNNLCSYFLNLSLVSRTVATLVSAMGEVIPTHEHLLEEGRRAHVCPYEIARLSLINSRIVVTTYHYLLDEAGKSVIFGNTGWKPSRTVAVVDEAHNLKDFVRDLFTRELSLEDTRRALNDASALFMEPATTFLEGLAPTLHDFCTDDKSWRVDRKAFLERMKASHDDTWLANIALELSTCAGIGWQSISTGRNLPTSVMKVGAFVRDLLSSEPGLTLAKSGDGFILVNTDTSRFSALTKDYQSLIMLSATVSPPSLFLRSLGLDERTTIHRAIVEQGFRVRTVIDTGVSTRFKLRSPETYREIARRIAAISNGTKGSIGIFLPSYAVLDSLTPFLSKELHDHEMIVESRGLTVTEAGRMIEMFKSSPGSILLAVQGARFSEGEDFPGDQMDVSVVVGFSLPPPTPIMYAELGQSPFEKHDAYLVVSLLPALRKAVQAAGRHIRSPDKKGMVFFMDSRFNQGEILGMIPEWLKRDLKVGNFQPPEIEKMVSSFFGNSP